MFFWVGLALVLMIAAGLMAWGVRDIGERTHEPGTQYLNRSAKRARR